MPGTENATKQDLKDLREEVRQDIEGFKEDIIHQFKVIAEGTRDEIKMIGEGHMMLAEKLDRVEQRVDQTEQNLTRRIDLLAGDLGEHRTYTKEMEQNTKSDPGDSENSRGFGGASYLHQGNGTKYNPEDGTYRQRYGGASV